MRPCERCGRVFPEVQGAPEQVCPHCGAAQARAAAAPSAPARAALVDPVAALGLAFRLYARHWGPLALLWSPAVLVNLAATLATVAYLDATGIPLEPTSVSDALRLLGVAVPAVLATFTVEFALWAFVAAYVGERTGAVAPGARRRLLRRWPAALGLGLLVTASLFAGFILLVVPFFVFLHWFAHAPAALSGGRSVARAIEASRSFARERRTYGFTVLIVLGWIAVAGLAFVVSLPLRALLAALGVPYAGEVAGVLAAWPFASIVPLLPAAYWSLARTASPQATPVRPDARPAERFRTTKCPRCSTLIPYSATGSLVHVVCPVCGFEGDVL